MNEKLIEKIDNLVEKDVIEEANYTSKFAEDNALWNLIKKYWPKETKELEKNGYDEKLWNQLKDNVEGSISRYGLGASINQSTGKVS